MSMENINNLCKGCFAELNPGYPVCPACGYDQNTIPDSLYQLHPRTILHGKYLVGKVLGEGGFGITYVGYDLNLHTKIAIKEYYPMGFVARSTTLSTTVQPTAGQQGEFFLKGRDRFVDEARRLARFRTLPGIVMVMDYFIENGTAYIVMEYVEGQDFKEYLTKMGGKLPPAQVFEMLKPVFSALAQIHETGIIHRDISPDNLMIDQNGNVKLLDFGAAREFGDEGNKSMSVMLKHGFAPLEQYSTKGVQGAHTDVYALSATIYRAITGTVPESSMDRVMSDTLLPPGGLGIYLEPHQEAALMKGLALHQENRFQTVAEFNSALTGQGDGSPVLQSAAPPPGQDTKGTGLFVQNLPQTPPIAPPQPPQPTPPPPMQPPPMQPAPPAQFTQMPQQAPPPPVIASTTPRDEVGAKQSNNKTAIIIGSAIIACVVIAVILIAILVPRTNTPGSNISNTPPQTTLPPITTPIPPTPTPTPAPNTSVYRDDTPIYYDNDMGCTLHKVWYEGDELHVTVFLTNGYSVGSISSITDFHIKISTMPDMTYGTFAKTGPLKVAVDIKPLRSTTWTFVISGDDLLKTDVDLNRNLYYEYSFKYYD